MVQVKYNDKVKYSINDKTIYKWKPHEYFNATQDEVNEIINFITKMKWSKTDFHKYFKQYENNLINKVKDIINKSHKENNVIQHSCFEELRNEWRKLALMRDFHDYVCGRDDTHHIRTDDCRRFINGIQKILNSNIYIKPVYRLLSDKQTKKFTHPKFTRFN